MRVNAVAPGFPTLTEMTGKMFGSQESFIAFAKSAVPVGAPGRVEDIADAVLYLASAPFVVGQVLTVDGGLTAQ